MNLRRDLPESFPSTEIKLYDSNYYQSRLRLLLTMNFVNLHEILSIYDELLSIKFIPKMVFVAKLIDRPKLNLFIEMLWIQ